MRSHFLPIAMIISGGVLYHVAQKSVPRTVNPFAAIMIAYAIGIALCAIGLAFDHNGGPFINSVKNSNWAVAALGLGALIIESGFLLAYRAGWDISVASVVTSISVALILIPIGLFVFKEHLSLRSAAGIACCLLGLYLISKK
ncbi:MAG TPA: EamA family transporter [Blastocatellia bacterium]|nr:EamA family transporter [Blastocatellia bacterium]